MGQENSFGTDIPEGEKMKIDKRPDVLQEDSSIIEALKRNDGDIEAAFMDLARNGLSDPKNLACLARLIEKYKESKKNTLH